MDNNVLDFGINMCTGCSACAVVCPRSAITIDISPTGFLYPSIKEDICINCGICKEVCYKYFKITDTATDYSNKKVIAVLNNYLDQMSTVSTVGVATQLAKFYLNINYNVCGVTLDCITDMCEHIVVKNYDDIDRLKGSKYLQSNFYNAFFELTNSNKKWLVFGLPCQIYGLRQVISKKGIEDNFILVDFFCAGIPTKNLWKQYKEFIKRHMNLNEIEVVNFRSKAQGWHKFSMELIDKNKNIYRQNIFNDLFFSFYLKRLCLNRPCYDCKLRHNKVFSDVRLGDFWGDRYREFDDGVELTVLLTEKGENAWENIMSSFRFEVCKTEDIFTSQKINQIPVPTEYNDILKALASGEKLEKIHTRFNVHGKGYK